MTTIEELRSRHPWWSEQMAPERWPRYRLILRTPETEKEKRELLPQGQFEKDTHFETRVKLSEWLGVLEHVVDRFIGGVFQEPAEFDFKSHENVKEWAGNVDGQQTSLTSWIEGCALESLVMGGIGVFVDRPAPDLAKAAALKVDPSKVSDRATVEKLGAYWPRLVTVRVEEIINWYPDAGPLEWVKLERLVREQKSPLGKAEEFVEWIIIDREKVQKFRAKLAESPKIEIVDKVGIDGSAIMTQQTLKFDGEPKEVTAAGGVPHGAGICPFEFLYGREVGLLRGKSAFAGTMRADVSRFREDSSGRFARYLHNVPLLKLKLGANRKVSEVIRENSSALKLNAEASEDADYASTPTDGFVVTQNEVEKLRLEGYAQGSADPSGMFDGGSQPESGKKARYRERQTEGRSMANYAANLAQFAQGILEIVTRRLSPTAPAFDAVAFTGSARYADRFDLETTQDLIDQWNEIGHEIQDDDWQKHMLTRIALKMAGDVSKEQADKFRKGIKALRLRASRREPGPAADPADDQNRRTPLDTGVR